MLTVSAGKLSALLCASCQKEVGRNGEWQWRTESQTNWRYSVKATGDKQGDGQNHGDDFVANERPQ